MLGALINVKDGERIIPVFFFGVPNATQSEASNYVDYCRARIKMPLKEITLKLCDDGKIDVSYLAMDVKFERIRRITGEPIK